MEDIQEALTFRDRFYAFFVTDDNMRWKTIGFIIVTGTAFAGLDIFFFNTPLDELVTVLTAWVLICYVVSIAWYCWFKSLPQLESVVPARRLILKTAAAVIAFVLTWRIPRAEAKDIERKLTEASQNPADSHSIQEATRLITVAQNNAIRLSSSVLANVAAKFVSASQQNPDAVNAATACADYQSSLTPFAYPATSPNRNIAPSYRIHLVEGKEHPTMEGYGRVPIAQAAQLHKNGEESLNKGPLGDEVIILEGGGVNIDDYYIKNVVFRDMYILYEGDPIELVNVRFIHCSFDFWNDPSALRLIPILASSRGPLTITLSEWRGKS